MHVWKIETFKNSFDFAGKSQSFLLAPSNLRFEMELNPDSIYFHIEYSKPVTISVYRFKFLVLVAFYPRFVCMCVGFVCADCMRFPLEQIQIQYTIDVCGITAHNRVPRTQNLAVCVLNKQLE